MADPKLSDEEMALLTDEERAGLLEEEEDDGTGDGDGDDAGGGDDEGDGDGTGDEDDAGVVEPGKPDPAADAAALAAAAAAAAAAVAAAAAPVAGQPAASEPLANADEPAADAVTEPEERAPNWILPVDLNDKLKAIDDKRNDLAQQWDNGELTATEYREKLAPLDSEAKTIERRQIKAEVALDFAKETWFGDVVPTFLSQHAEYKNPVLHGLLEQEVRRLQSEAVNPLNPKILAKAHETISKQIKDAYGIGADGKKDEPGKKPEAGKTPASPKRPDPPPTLAHVPAADPNDADDGGEFAHIDRLLDSDSIAYEKALAKLPEEARDRYLASR